MSRIHETLIYGRFEDICPVKCTDDMSIRELKQDTHTAFNIIGFTSTSDIDEIVESVYLDKDIPLLYEFVFEVWLNAQ